jgi:hypothetical protein
MEHVSLSTFHIFSLPFICPYHIHLRHLRSIFPLTFSVFHYVSYFLKSFGQ